MLDTVQQKGSHGAAKPTYSRPVADVVNDAARMGNCDAAQVCTHV
jgi:hypothetical protein